MISTYSVQGQPRGGERSSLPRVAAPAGLFPSLPFASTPSSVQRRGLSASCRGCYTTARGSLAERERLLAALRSASGRRDGGALPCRRGGRGSSEQGRRRPPPASQRRGGLCTSQAPPLTCESRATPPPGPPSPAGAGTAPPLPSAWNSRVNPFPPLKRGGGGTAWSERPGQAGGEASLRAVAGLKRLRERGGVALSPHPGARSSGAGASALRAPRSEFGNFLPRPLLRPPPWAADPFTLERRALGGGGGGAGFSRGGFQQP